MLVAAVAEAVRIHPAMQSCQFPIVSHRLNFFCASSEPVVLQHSG